MGELAAIMRAIHQTADDEPKILADPIAPRLVDVGGGDDDELGPLLHHPFAKQWRAGFLIRNRYAEDCLAEGVARGIRQHAILGAGLDTFAFRQPTWAKPIRIYEVDHPATQRWKRDQLAAAAIAVPENLAFVPMDFERDSLAESLRKNGFDLGAQTFFSWLGVTQYLSQGAIAQTLEFVLAFPRGSEIVFSFILPFATVSGLEGDALAKAADQSKQVGEPWLSTFNPEDLAALLRAMGFSIVVHMTPADAQERYLKHRRDGMQARRGEQLMRAIV
jgi:methyltransferase (TIGR00027 family)